MLILPNGTIEEEILPGCNVACLQGDQGSSWSQQLDDAIAKGLAAVPEASGQALVWEQAFRSLQELLMKASLQELLQKLQLAVLRSADMTPVSLALQQQEGSYQVLAGQGPHERLVSDDASAPEPVASLVQHGNEG